MSLFCSFVIFSLTVAAGRILRPIDVAVVSDG